ncbi:TMV resistance protein N-like isoform X5 [Solanum tuberosum]|uniref:TMV resistance protein N-like isoform X5 n=1 Tax=Solanum tuberosum TaxID=4113 RepID=UPI00073A1CC9|nr:PREDICTED: TMV resistance protein N-like isoform X5 [Solanum tuberosum]
MASSSSVSSPRCKYEVFLSFRGEDTRRNFMSHLYQGLKNRGIVTFLDDKRLEDGDSISEELMKAIEETQVAVIIFSKNYATSSWCLNELVKIMECKKKENGHMTVIPVFCNVDASHVRYQSQSFKEAFAKHESRYKDDDAGMQKVQRWRTALTAAADLKGYVFPSRGESDADCIKGIVDQISSKCNTSVSYLQDVMGLDTQLKKVESLLKMEINDIDRIVWIWGMGGIGKTTIAKKIFYELSSKFEVVCFLENIKENKHKIHSLQNILLSKLLGEKENCVDNKEAGRSMLYKRLLLKKVLIVLDDIDHIDQLEYLAKDLSWFGKGSRIIATTRDQHLIGENDVVYEMETLLDRDAIKLFNQYAFKEKVPNECFKDLTLEIVSLAKGHPLALKVWGSSLHRMNKTEWESALVQIKKNSGVEITENLRISYDGLESEQQEIFLDIACFFRGIEKEKVKQVLESCYSRPEFGLRVLVNKSLVSISEYGKIEMHDLIQDMGKCIVKKGKHLGEHSRLWNVKDFKEVVDNNMGTMAVEAIWLTYSGELWFSKDAMKNMQRLRILCIQSYPWGLLNTYKDQSSQSDSEDEYLGVIEYLSNNLCWFVWHEYPWKLLPRNFNPRRLVHLDLRWSSLHYLWNETKLQQFLSLRRIDLSHSKSLKRTPDFKGMPNLKYLDLNKCRSLEEVHPSLKDCKELKQLNLSFCSKLERFPYVNVESLGSLNLYYCPSLEKFPEILGIMKQGTAIQIITSYTGIRDLPLSFFDHQLHLIELRLDGMKNLVSLPSSICKSKGLVKLDVSKCSKLESLPEEIGDLENLEELHANNTLISRPPSSIVRLNKLKSLTFAKEKSEDGLLFVFPLVNEGLLSLEYLDLSYSNIIDGGLPEDIGCLSSLEDLNLSGNNFEHLPHSIAHLGLEYLNLSDCQRLTQLPEFPQQLHTIHADWSNASICNSLFQNISSLQHDICSSHSLSLRVFGSWSDDIPRWFHHHEVGRSISVKLPENWYISDNFLGFAVCYSGKHIDCITAHLIPLCDDGMSSKTQQFSLSDNSELDDIDESVINFLLVPLGGLWDASNANEKTPNDYGCIKLDFIGETDDAFGETDDDFEETDDEFGENMKFGVRLLYKNESELCIGKRKSRYEEEATCSSSKKLLQLFPTSPGL